MRKCRNDYVLRDLYRVFLIFLLFYEQAKANITSQKNKTIDIAVFHQKIIQSRWRFTFVCQKKMRSSYSKNAAFCNPFSQTL